MKLLSERLKWAMQQKTKRDRVEVIPASVARAAKASNATVNYWLNDVNGISAAKARLVGAYLGVNPLWLETGDGESAARMKAQPDAPSKEPRLILAYEKEEKLLDLFRRLDERGQAEAYTFLERRAIGDLGDATGDQPQ